MSENIPQSGQGQPQHPQGYGNDGYQNPNPAQPYGNPNMHQSVPPQEQGGQYQQDPNQFGNPVPGAPNQQIPQPNGLTRKTLHSLRETHMLVSPSQQHRQRQTLSLKLSRMFGAASLMSLRANRATHIKDCRTANLGDGLSL